MVDTDDELVGDVNMPPRPKKRVIIRTANVGNVTQLRSLQPFGTSVQCLAFSPKSHLLALGADPIEVFRVADGALLGSMAFGWPGAEGIVFHPSGNIIIGVSANYPKFILWDANTFAKIRDVNVPIGHGPGLVAITPSGETIATGGFEGKVIFWDWKNGNPAPRSTLDAHTTYITSLAFSRDGLRLATGDENGRLRLWRASFDLVADGYAEVPTGGPSAGSSLPEVSGLSFNGRGTILAASNWDSNLYVIDAFDGHTMAKLTEPPGATNQQMFAGSSSPRNELIVSSQSSAAFASSLIEFWDVPTQALVR